MSGLVAWVQGRYQGRKLAVGKGSDDATGTWWWSFMIHDNPWLITMIRHYHSWSMAPWRSMTINDDAWWSIVMHDDPRWFLMLVAWVLFVFYALGQVSPDGSRPQFPQTQDNEYCETETLNNLQHAICPVSTGSNLMLTQQIISMNDGGDGNAMVLMIAIMCQRPKLMI